MIKRAPLPASLRAHYQWFLARSDTPPSRLLDIGAGQGRLLSVARDVVRKRLVGIDPRKGLVGASIIQLRRSSAMGRDSQSPTASSTLSSKPRPLSGSSVPWRFCVRLGACARPTAWSCRTTAIGTPWCSRLTTRTLGRRILRAFCDSGPNGWIGRTAPSLMRRAGLRDSRSPRPRDR